MSRLDALPADQKSVLQLLLRQGKGYDDLSGLLRLDADEVRSRAYDALDTLGPGAGGLPAERRHEIADWLLGQQDPERGRGHPRLRRRLDGRARVGARRRPRARAARRRPPARAARRGRGDRRRRRRAGRASRRAPPPPPSPRPRPPGRASRAAAARCSSAARSPPSPSPSCSSSSSPAATTTRRPPARRPRPPTPPRPRLSRRSARRSTSPRPRARRSRRPWPSSSSSTSTASRRSTPPPRGCRRQQEGRLRAVVLQQPVAGQAHRRLRPDRQQGPPRPPGPAAQGRRHRRLQGPRRHARDDRARTRRRPARSTCAGRSRTPPAASPTAAACRGS